MEDYYQIVGGGICEHGNNKRICKECKGIKDLMSLSQDCGEDLN